MVSFNVSKHITTLIYRTADDEELLRLCDFFWPNFQNDVTAALPGPSLPLFGPSRRRIAILRLTSPLEPSSMLGTVNLYVQLTVIFP